MYIFVVVSNVPVDTRIQNPVYTRLIKSTLENTKEEEQERQTLVCFNQRGTRTRKRKKNERKKRDKANLKAFKKTSPHSVF